MATKNPRLNVVLDKDLYAAIAVMAKEHGISMSLQARDLLREAAELQEDTYWNAAAEKRVKTYARGKAVSHADAWK